MSKFQNFKVSMIQSFKLSSFQNSCYELSRCVGLTFNISSSQLSKNNMFEKGFGIFLTFRGDPFFGILGIRIGWCGGILSLKLKTKFTMFAFTMEIGFSIVGNLISIVGNPTNANIFSYNFHIEPLQSPYRVPL